MATKSSHTTPEESNRPASSGPKPGPKAKAKAAGAVPKSTSAKPTKGAAAKPAAKADGKSKPAAVAKPKAMKMKAAGSEASKPTAPKTSRVKRAASKPRSTSSEASRMAGRRKTSTKSAKAASSSTKSRARSSATPADASAYENHVVKTLFDSLEAHVAAHELGHVVGPKEFELGASEPTGRLPDIAFISFDRWAPYRRVPSHERWHVAPDLLVQVVRKGELAEDFTVQLDECFNAGVRRVWMLFPEKGEARVYESAADVKTLGDGQSIEGGDVLPGYEHSLTLLFREPKDPT